MKIRKEVVINYLFFFALIGIAVGTLYFFDVKLTGLAVYGQINQTDFDQGTYENTIHNGSAVVLVGENLSGSYTSKIFDSGGLSLLNNLSWQGNNANLESLFAVDGQADIWQSIDLGASWSLLKDDYNSADNNGATYMIKNSSGSLFILYNQDLWVSDDQGTSWTKINDDYNGAEGQNAYVIDIDSSNNIFIIEGGQDVWQSTDSGTTFNKVSTDFNGGNGNILGITIDSSDNLFVVDSQADVWQSTNSGVDWTLVKDDYNAGNSNDADDMAINSLDSLFILHNQDVWKSTNSGVDWTLVNDDFNGAGDSNSGQVIYVDSNDNLHLADGSEDFFSSSNSGINFSLLSSNFNGGNGNIFGLNSLIDPTTLTFQVKNCSLANCSDGNFIDANLSNLNLTGRYFQYKTFFSSPDSSITPQLFKINIDYSPLAPEINITSPLDSELFNYNASLPLNFTITNASSLDSCWYTLDNGINNITISNCQNTFFNSSDGTFTLRTYVNDSSGNTGTDSVNFSVSALGVLLSILEPTGTKTSRTGISISYTVTGNNLTCWYNVKTSIGGDVLLNTSLINCSDSSFDVATDGDYILNLYSNNSLGVSAYENSSFTVDTSSGGGGGNSGGGSNGGGSGSSGGGGSSSIPIISGLNKLEIEPISNLILTSKDNKELILSVRNAGTNFLNDCKLKGNANFSSWIFSSETKDLSAGEKYDFVFDLNFPLDVKSKAYNLSVILECREVNKSINFLVEIIEEKINFELIKVERILKDKVKIIYSLEELSGVNQDIELQFLLFNSDNEKEAEIKETKTISANLKQEFNILIPVNPNLEGEINLLVNINSDIYSTFVQENIILGAPLSGFAVFSNEGSLYNIPSLVLTILFLVFAFFMIKKILGHRKELKIKKSVKVIKKRNKKN